MNSIGSDVAGNLIIGQFDL